MDEALAHFHLFRSDRNGPPFAAPCSWSDNLESAKARRAQLVWSHGFGTIWVADICVQASRLLDLRADPAPVWALLDRSPGSARLRDAIHEGAAALIERGYRLVAFDEDDQPGAEYVYLAGQPVEAVRAEA